jgi:hypothetical protein
MSDDARVLIATIAEVRDAFQKAALSQRSFGYTDVRSGIECRNYGTNGIRIEYDLEVQVSQDTGCTWWLEFWFDDTAWRIERSLLRDSSDGQHVMMEWAPVVVPNIDVLTQILPAVAAELLVTSFNLPDTAK